MASTVIIDRPMEVSTTGVSLIRYKEFTVSDGRRKETMVQQVAFFAGAVVCNVSEERHSRTHGTYVSVEVALEQGPAYVIFADHMLNSVCKLEIGKAFNFEGPAIAGKHPMLRCMAVVNGTLSVAATGKYRNVA